jgi:hypothetical protein
MASTLDGPYFSTFHHPWCDNWLHLLLIIAQGGREVSVGRNEICLSVAELGTPF